MPNQIDEAEAPGKQISQFNQLLATIGFKHLILDCSCVNSVDLMGANAIIQV